MTKTTKNSKEFGEYIFPAEAARIADIAKQSMAYLVRRGHFTTTEVAGRILVLRSEVESYFAKSKGRSTSEMQARKKSPKRQPEIIDGGIRGRYISQAEAARLRGVSKQAIANLIHRGRLTTVSVADRTLVLRKEVEAFVSQSAGRPPKKKPSIKTASKK